MKNKNKLFVIILGVLLIASLLSSIGIYFSKVSIEEVNDREELLVATMTDLYNGDHDIDVEDIVEIKVLKSKAGVPPMNYNVALNMKNGEQILYSWHDESKTKVTNNLNK